jgi:hypothetical protein
LAYSPTSWSALSVRCDATKFALRPLHGETLGEFDTNLGMRAPGTLD